MLPTESHGVVHTPSDSLTIMAAMNQILILKQTIMVFVYGGVRSSSSYQRPISGVWTANYYKCRSSFVILSRTFTS